MILRTSAEANNLEVLGGHSVKEVMTAGEGDDLVSRDETMSEVPPMLHFLARLVSSPML